MKTNKILLYLGLITVLALGLITYLCAEEADDRSIDIEYVHEVFEDAVRIEEDPDDPDFYIVKNDAGVKIGTVLSTSPHSDDVLGYAGPVPVLIGFELKNTIAGITLLENRETPGYLLRLGGREFFDSWNGLSIAEAREKKVDAVTGATRTSAAVIESIKTCLKHKKRKRGRCPCRDIF